MRDWNASGIQPEEERNEREKKKEGMEDYDEPEKKMHELN